jgi:D-inositol-3-phosphate glycosyltransferase
VAGRALLGFEARLADSVIACSAAVARQFADSANVTTIHPGVEQGPPGDGASLRRAAGIAADAPLIASVGNITRGRGQDVLLRALAKLLGARPGLRCAIEGATFPRPADLEFSTELDRLQRELGLGDAVVRTSGSAIADLYAAADVIVNPATTHAESFGRVPLEAGLAGTPAVCTRVGAIPELHADGATALLVPPGDSDALAGAIARVLDDPELGRRLAGGAADLARRIASPERSLAAFQDLIGTYIGS